MLPGAAVISIGDEIITGTVVDTNSAWISEFLMERGIETVLHLSVGDDMDKIISAFSLAAQNARLVIVSGGLGPTSDDLTTDAFCRFAGVEKSLRPEALADIENKFKAIGMQMTPNNKKQAELPQGSALLENPIGTAPGYYKDVDGTRFCFVPGVPRECRLMVETRVWPAIQELVAKPETIRCRTLRTFGLTESMLDTMLAGIRINRGCSIGYRAIFPEIQVKLTARGEKAEDLLQSLLAAVREKIAEFIFSEDGKPIEQVVGEILKQKTMKLALAESCTGGLIAKRITDIPGSSAYFERGFVTYSNDSKVQLLGVSPQLIKQYGAVSRQVATAMAEGARKKSGADLALAVTGIAGPTGGTAEKPVGTVHFGLSHQDRNMHFHFLFARPDRQYIRELTSQAALEIIRRFLLGMPMPGK